MFDSARSSLALAGLATLALASLAGCARDAITVDGVRYPTRPSLPLVRGAAELRWRWVSPTRREGDAPPAGAVAVAGASEPDAAEVRTRIALVDRTLRDEVAPAIRYRWGWVVTFTGLVAFNVVRAALSERAEPRDAGIVGAVGSGLGLGSALLAPPRATYAAGEFLSYRSSTTDPPLTQLRRGERLWRQVAEAEEFNRSWVSQLGRAGIATTLGLVLVALGHFEAPGLNVGAGLIIGQLTVRSYPYAALRRWQQYTERFPDAGAPVRRFSYTELAAAPIPGGMAFALSF